MATVSQRAERIDIIRDLVVLGFQSRIQRRSELRQVAIEEKVLVTESDGRPLSKTSVYRYLDVLRFLGFDESKEYGIEDDIVWSSSAMALAQHGTANFRTYELSMSEKAIFRGRIFLSGASEQFLSCFCAGGTIPRNHRQFLAEARPLYVVNVSVTRPAEIDEGDDEWPAQDNVEISLDPEAGRVIRRPTKEFLYTYRYWCLDAGIIEELNVREAARCGVPRTHSYILFPLEPIEKTTSVQFLEIIYAVLGRKLEQPQAVPIPWLMYRICPEVRISVEDFKSILLETWQDNRHLLHLERGPGGLIEGKIFSPEHKNSERYGNQRYYLVVDGTVRSNLVIFPKT